jgi:hypothetical protein
MPDHATAERRSLRYHKAIAERLAVDASIAVRALARVDGWLREGTVAAYYAEGWREVLNRTPAELRAFLADPSERARALRQVSPFAGVLSPQERWKLWAAKDDGDDATAA